MVRLTDPLNMTIVVDWDIKPQINQTSEDLQWTRQLVSLDWSHTSLDMFYIAHFNIAIPVLTWHHAKTCLMPYATNKGADQPTHPCSLISTFVVCSLDREIPVVAMYVISRLELASAAEQAGLSQTSEERFSR